MVYHVLLKQGQNTYIFPTIDGALSVVVEIGFEQGHGSGYFSNASASTRSASASTASASASTNKKEKNDR